LAYCYISEDEISKEGGKRKMELIIFLLLAIIGILIICMIVQQNVCDYKLEQIADESYDVEIRASRYSNKLTLITSEVDSIDLSKATYSELHNSYKRIKKVIDNADTSTTTINN
jgi:hypothetical protein